MLSKLDAWIKANPYVSKLVVAVVTSLLGWFTHKYLGVDVPPVPVEQKHATKHVYGWKPASPELRAAVHAKVGGHTLGRVNREAPLPAVYEVQGTGPVLDQGQLGSCGPNAMDSLLFKAGVGFDASRLFTYYETRKLMGTVREDSGVINSQMVQAVHDAGFVPESEWPYRVERFKTKPSAKVVRDAKARAGAKFVAVAVSVADVKTALAQDLPVLVGINVYESFESDAVDKSGDVPMPGADEQLLGGHDVVVVGWDDGAKRFKFKNSWSESWGAKGFGTLPYDYVTGQGSDFWALLGVK